MRQVTDGVTPADTGASAIRRVMIIGQPGSGKSTLARLLGEATGLPVKHVDHIHWMPGWQERDSAEKARLCREIHAREHWIFEGGHSVTWPERLARADLLIWLDVPLAVRAFRVARRTLRDYGRTRPDLPENCPERFDGEFWRWIWQTRRSGRANCRMCAEAAAGSTPVLHLRRLAHVNRYVGACAAEGRIRLTA